MYTKLLGKDREMRRSSLMELKGSVRRVRVITNVSEA